MLKRQISLLAIATLLLSPTLVRADEIGEITNIYLSNIQIQTDGYGATKIQTPNVEIVTTHPFVNRWLISSRKRRMRTSVRKPVVRSGQIISAPSVMSPPPIAQPPIAQPSSDSNNRSVVNQTSTIRSSSQTSNNGSHSEQHSSVECSSSGSGTSVTRSTQTINGRTVSAEVRTNCP